MSINKSQLKIHNTSYEVININIITLKNIAYNSDWHCKIINISIHFSIINTSNWQMAKTIFYSVIIPLKTIKIKISKFNYMLCNKLSTVSDRSNLIPEDIRLGVGIHRNQAAVGQGSLLAEDIQTHCTEDNSFFQPLIYIYIYNLRKSSQKATLKNKITVHLLRQSVHLLNLWENHCRLKSLDHWLNRFSTI